MQEDRAAARRSGPVSALPVLPVLLVPPVSSRNVSLLPGVVRAMLRFPPAVVCLPFMAVLVLPSLASAQDRKQAHATRIPNGVIRLDGALDESAWSAARAITD